MPQWITDIQGVTTVKNAAGVAQPRRHVIKFTGAAVTDDGTQTVVGLPGAGAVQSITGNKTTVNDTNLQAQITSIVNALVALGLATDNRT